MEKENKTSEIFFSVIIPIKKINTYLWQNCEKLAEQNYKNFEIIILPDELDEEGKVLEKKYRVKIIPTGLISPGEKRNKGAWKAKGNFLAFIDDDAYPAKDWLQKAQNYFISHPKISALGGPQITPAEDNFWEKANGAMFLSPLAGNAVIRYQSDKKSKEVDDWPSVNFFIWREDFQKIGGFNESCWPGEDTKLCLDIVKKLKKKILYAPDLIVYHHRRGNFIKHLEQVGRYGFQRGNFAKVFPETSCKFFYFMPSFFALFLVLGISGLFFSDLIFRIFIAGLLIYFVVVFISVLVVWIKIKNFLIALTSALYLIPFHIWYGVKFTQGLIFGKKFGNKQVNK